MLKINSSSSLLVIPLKFLIPLFPSLHNSYIFQALYWMKCYPFPLSTYFFTHFWLVVATLARRHALALTSLARDISFSSDSFQEALGATETWAVLCSCLSSASNLPFYLWVEKELWQRFGCFLPVWRERGPMHICRGEIREWGTSSAWDLIKGELASEILSLPRNICYFVLNERGQIKRAG